MSRERANYRHPLSLLSGRTASRLRRGLAAALFLAAAVLAVLEGSGEPARGVPTVVAAHELDSGTRLSTADVRVVRFPERLRPAGAFESAADVTGRLLSGAAGGGEPLTSTRLIGGAESAPGMTTVPVRLADSGIAHLLKPGTTVDVVTLASSGTAGRVLASGVTVLTVTRTSEQDSEDDTPLVLLAVPDDAATSLAAAALNQPVTVTLG